MPKRIKTTMPATEVRKEFFKILKDIDKPNRTYTITLNGEPRAVMMSAEEFESWRETLEVMQDFPDLAKDIEEAEKEFKRGEYVTLEEVLEKEGFVLADKSKK
ncbi:type II toxin-antitoxin system Phd/YefM family antitoxin [Patescibacteria group bacterium AH-259-L07]|nr:type II toxin-antitoxin system Phd/YefM family antitoxin [Patescibacteria group bacterium AH-259-L07]